MMSVRCKSERRVGHARRGPARCLASAILLLLLATQAVAAPPNVVILVADDLGYGDLSCYGMRGIRTPNLDRLARDGVRLTNFFSAAPVGSASRAALWTGCYPCRVGVAGDLRPESEEGLAPERITLAEVARDAGYRTALLGTWRLGSRPEFLPTRQGFDQFYGIPFSHNVHPVHVAGGTALHPNLPLYDGEQVIGSNPKMATFTQELTERAIEFINDSNGRPFLLCVAYAMPQVPLAVSGQFIGISKRGLYGDVVTELDWSVGRILDTLTANRLDASTMVIFTSDNGPALEYGQEGGSAGVLRGGEGSTFEGGMRVPCVIRWTGKIPAQAISDELAVNFDLFPTVARQIGGSLPAQVRLDGRDIWPVLTLPSAATSPHRCFYYYLGGALHAVRSGRWKLHFPHGYNTVLDEPASSGQPRRASWQRIGLSLFDLQTDPGETVNVATDNEEIVRYLARLAETARNELGDTLTRRPPKPP